MSFIVQLQTNGITNIVLMSLSYMAVDQASFPYYYNAFCDVPLNYASSLVIVILIRPISQLPLPHCNPIFK